MATFTRTTATEWVCVDCHQSIAGYAADDMGRPMPEPFADVEGIEDVTNGTPIAECTTPECVEAVRRYIEEGRDDVRDMEAEEAHTECDHDSFSLHPCAGCRSSLAGDRYAVTVSYVEWTD